MVMYRLFYYCWTGMYAVATAVVMILGTHANAYCSYHDRNVSLAYNTVLFNFEVLNHNAYLADSLKIAI